MIAQVRPCTPDDAAAVSTLLRELGYRVSIPLAVERIRELGATGSDPILLAEADGTVVGLLASHRCRMLQYARPVTRITALVVGRDARRRGVGRLLMDHAERMAVAEECEFVELTSAADRADAHAFYRGIGYETNSLRFRKLPGGRR